MPAIIEVVPVSETQSYIASSYGTEGKRTITLASTARIATIIENTTASVSIEPQVDPETGNPLTDPETGDPLFTEVTTYSYAPTISLKQGNDFIIAESPAINYTFNESEVTQDTDTDALIALLVKLLF